VGLWNYVRLPARDGPIPVFTACSLRCFTGTIYTIAVSPLESLLDSLLQCLLERAALERAALERTAFERAMLREE